MQSSQKNMVLTSSHTCWIEEVTWHSRVPRRNKSNNNPSISTNENGKALVYSNIIIPHVIQYYSLCYKKGLQLILLSFVARSHAEGDQKAHLPKLRLFGAHHQPLYIKVRMYSDLTSDVIARMSPPPFPRLSHKNSELIMCFFWKRL